MVADEPIYDSKQFGKSCRSRDTICLPFSNINVTLFCLLNIISFCVNLNFLFYRKHRLLNRPPKNSSWRSFLESGNRRPLWRRLRNCIRWKLPTSKNSSKRSRATWTSLTASCKRFVRTRRTTIERQMCDRERERKSYLLLFCCCTGEWWSHFQCQNSDRFSGNKMSAIEGGFFFWGWLRCERGRGPCCISNRIAERLTELFNQDWIKARNFLVMRFTLPIRCRDLILQSPLIKILILFLFLLKNSRFCLWTSENC